MSSQALYLAIRTVLGEIDFLSHLPSNVLDIVASELCKIIPEFSKESDGSTAGPFFPEQLL